MSGFLSTLDDGQLWLTLDRPAKLNAIDPEMRHGLTSAIREAGADPAVKVVVLTGAGERAFTAGQDLAEMTDLDEEGGAQWVQELAALYDSIRALDKPSLVAINGYASGGGIQIALHADYRIAVDHARLGQPEIDAGMPSVLGPWVIRAALGLAVTRDLALSGRFIGAADALRLGAVDEVVPVATLATEARARAATLAAAPPLAVALTKQRMRALTESSWRATVAHGEVLARAAFSAGEPQATARAFLAARSAKHI
jgi:enoyl-CoA hydratase